MGLGARGRRRPWLSFEEHALHSTGKKRATHPRMASRSCMSPTFSNLAYTIAPAITPKYSPPPVPALPLLTLYLRPREFMGLFLALTFLSAVVPAWYYFKLGGHGKSTFPAHWVCDLFNIYLQIAAVLFFVGRLVPTARDMQELKELFQLDEAPPS